MTTFLYTAKKKTSETVTGQISAQTQDEAIEFINQLGLLPVSVDTLSAGKKALENIPQRNIKTKELCVFSRQLANLLKSGEVLLRALAIVGEQTPNMYFQKIIAHIALDIKNGRAFSESLSSFPHIFSSLYITMVRAGEESSHLEEMLMDIALYLRKQDKIMSKIRGALAYPCFMAAAGIVTIYFIMTFVLPKMAGLFEHMGDDLPGPTVVLLSVSHGLSALGIWGFLALIFLGFGVYQWGNSRQGKSFLSYVTLQIPLWGEILIKTDLARFCRTLVLLQKGGVSIIPALNIAIPVLKNNIMQDHLLKCKEVLTAGGSFGESLKTCKEIPNMMGHLISVAEESGNLEEVLSEIAMTYEQENDEKIKMMMTLLEPAMILGVGLGIGFIIFAMLLPVFQMDVLV